MNRYNRGLAAVISLICLAFVVTACGSDSAKESPKLKLGLVQSQVGLSGFFIEAVALEAVFGEDRTDVAIEIELFGGVLFSGEREPWADAGEQ